MRQDWALAIGAGLTAFGVGLLTPVLPGYAQTLGASLSVVGLLLASFGVARLVTALPAAGRFGHVRLLIASPGLTAPVAALCAIAGGFWPLAVFCMVEAVTAAMYTTVGTPPERAKAPNDKAGLRRSLVVLGLIALWLLAFAIVFTRVGLQLALVPLLGAWRLGLNPQQIGLAFSVNGFVSLILFYPAGWLADRYGRRVVIGLGGLGMVGALALFGGATTYLVFVLGAIVLGVGSGLAGPGPAAYLADILPVEERTVGVGIYRMVGDAGASLALPVLGWLAERGGYGVALLSAATLLLTTVVAFAWFGRATDVASTAEPHPRK